MGVSTDFVDVTHVDSVEQALQKNTKLLFVKPPSNPTMRIADLRALADLTHAHGMKLMVDNTFATPYNQNPLTVGADVVVHSCTKYLNGHSDVMAGAILGTKDHITECTNVFRKLGSNLNGFDAWLLMRGMKTFGLRMAQHHINGQATAEFLVQHPKVATVRYPGLATDPQHTLARARCTGSAAW